MGNDKNKQLDKKIKRELTRKSNMRWMIIIGSLMLVIVVGLLGYTMSRSYDATQTTTTNLYKNEISYEQMQQKVANNEEFFAYFYQPDCVHCEAVSPFLFPLADSMHKTVLPVNIKGKQKIWDDYHVHGTPTLVHFKGGKEVGRIDGERPEMEYSHFLNS